MATLMFFGVMVGTLLYNAQQAIVRQAFGADTDGAGEQKVQVLAAHSLDNLDVATEAMAEVWIKQGNPEKAMAIYQKLSLSNPAKSAYFAAKIEYLKNANH